MEFKQIKPAYATYQDVEKISRLGKVTDVLMSIKNFSNRFSQNNSEDNESFHRNRRFDRRSKLKLNFNKKNLIRWGGITVIAAIVLIGGARLINNSGNPSGIGSSNNGVNIKGAKATQDLNKEFKFPLTNSNGEVVSELAYEIESVELRDEIIVQGNRATAVEGRTFLILTIKITNEYTSSVEINTRDYVRLSVNNTEEWLAPEVHNDPVEVQAISTKYTRLGFPINNTDENLRLRIGQLDGEKEIIEIDL